MPLFLSGWFATWSITTSYILQQIRGEDKIKIFYSASFVNSVAILIPMAYISSGVYLTSLASYSYRKSLATYVAIDSQLAVGEQLISNGGKFSLLDLLPLSALEAKLADDFEIFTTRFRQLIMTKSIFALLLIFVSTSLTTLTFLS